MRITAPPGPANGRRHNLQRGAVGRLRQKRRRGRTPWSEPSSFRRHSDSDIRPMSQVPHHRSWRGGSLRPSGRALALQHRPRRQHRRLSRARARSCSSSRGRRRCRGGTGDGLNERRRADGYREALELLRTRAEFRPGLRLERATHLLLLFVGTDVYHALVDGRGWSHDEAGPRFRATRAPTLDHRTT
jgi:hypothetical protein